MVGIGKVGTYKLEHINSVIQGEFSAKAQIYAQWFSVLSIGSTRELKT